MYGALNSNKERPIHFVRPPTHGGQVHYKGVKRTKTSATSKFVPIAVRRWPTALLVAGPDNDWIREIHNRTSQSLTTAAIPVTYVPMEIFWPGLQMLQRETYLDAHTSNQTHSAAAPLIAQNWHVHGRRLPHRTSLPTCLLAICLY